MSDFQKIKEFFNEGDYREAFRAANKLLNREPDNMLALYGLADIVFEGECFGLARQLYMRVAQEQPHQWQAWLGFGKAAQECHLYDEAKDAFQKTLALNPRDHSALSNLGSLAVQDAEPHKAIDLFTRALALHPDSPAAHFNRGLAYLMLGRWREGWEDYEANLGKKRERKEIFIRDREEPRWTGEKGQTVLCYGEQGIGDQINFGSCLPDLIRDSRKVIILVSRKLDGLFRRSFPQAEVFGSLNDNGVEWADSYQFDSRVAIGSLPKFYRNADSDFPGTPYLNADPERRLQWRTLLDRLPGLKIGLAWNGGVFKTLTHRRCIELAELSPILETGNTFISLEYRDPSEDLKAYPQIRHWPRATLTEDYDETAALVAELDLVVTVQTAVFHLAGALGVPTLCLVPDKPRFIYLLEGERLPWYASAKLLRQKDGRWPIGRLVREIESFRR